MIILGWEIYFQALFQGNTKNVHAKSAPVMYVDEYWSCVNVPKAE